MFSLSNVEYLMPHFFFGFVPFSALPPSIAVDDALFRVDLRCDVVPAPSGFERGLKDTYQGRTLKTWE
jgi:hypothetical protein